MVLGLVILFVHVSTVMTGLGPGEDYSTFNLVSGTYIPETRFSSEALQNDGETQTVIYIM